jgi:hypothetical protein
MKKTTVLLSMAELNHIICALEVIKINGEYYGNREHFWKRHDRLHEMLVVERDELTAKIVPSKE